MNTFETKTLPLGDDPSDWPADIIELRVRLKVISLQYKRLFVDKLEAVFFEQVSFCKFKSHY